MRPLSHVSTCIACGAARVVPLDRPDRPHGWWWLRVRCGECGTARQVVVDDAEARRFELDLERAAEEIAEALRAFQRA